MRKPFPPKRGGFANEPSIHYIRRLSGRKDDEAYKYVRELYRDKGARLKGLIDAVEEALRVGPTDGMPAVIRTSIIMHSPDVYLLLLYMAYKGRLNDFGKIAGIATWLHWFVVGDRKMRERNCRIVVNEIKTVVDTGDLPCLRKCLSDLCEKRLLLWLDKASDENFRSSDKFLNETGDKLCDWKYVEQQEWYPLLFKIWTLRELVIFATRRYFNPEFEYDPAEVQFWTGHARPWDMDHIVPKSWVSKKRVKMGPWKEVCLKWIGSNGNFAAIPFTDNRSKNDQPNWTYYEDEERAKSLFFDKELEKLNPRDLTCKPDQARMFIELTHKRMIDMYEEWRKEVVDFLD